MIKLATFGNDRNPVVRDGLDAAQISHNVQWQRYEDVAVLHRKSLLEWEWSRRSGSAESEGGNIAYCPMHGKELDVCDNDGNGFLIRRGMIRFNTVQDVDHEDH